MVKNDKIKELVFSFMDMVGIKHKEVEAGLWHAKIPASEKLFFNGFDVFKFTFDKELAERHRDLELICEGSFMLRKIIERLAEIPKASRLFSTAKPEVPRLKDKEKSLRLVKKGKPVYRQQVIFNFKVRFECDQRKERLFSVKVDPAEPTPEIFEGIRNIDLSEFSEEPDPEYKIEDSGLDFIKFYLDSCRMLEKSIEEDVHHLKNWGENQCAEQMKKFEEYLNEQKQELLNKKENVSFHLYFFQKEEEIEELIKKLDAERERKISELKDKFSLRVSINLVNAVVLCIPTVATRTVGKRTVAAGSGYCSGAGNVQALAAG